MGYNIKVDHSKFESTANVLLDYTEKMKKNMRKADTAVSTMMHQWQGEDAYEFNAKWATVSGGDSTYEAMRKSIESYANFLKSAGEKYKQAQINAVNAANSLPWI